MTALVLGFLALLVFHLYRKLFREIRESRRNWWAK